MLRGARMILASPLQYSTSKGFKMAIWQIVAQQETRDGKWSGSVQVPTFYVDAHTLSGAVRKAVDVLWEGRNPSGPVHLTVTEVAGDLGMVPGARVRSFAVIRDGDPMPIGQTVVTRLMLGRLDVAGAPGEERNWGEGRRLGEKV